MNKLLAAMRMQAAMVGNDKARVRSGVVDSYDPSTYAVKVRIQPEGAITGWMPLDSPWVGNQWGIFAPPSIGDQVVVTCLEDDPSVGYVSARTFNDEDRPLSVQSGEFWLVHKSGSLLKFHNDGSVDVVSNTDLRATVGQNLTAHVVGNAGVAIDGNLNASVGGNASATVAGAASLAVTGNLTTSAATWNHTGVMNVSGAVHATGDVTAGSISLQGHKHSGVQSGVAISGGPV